MDIKEFQKELKRLLRDSKTMESWLAYHSRFNHQRNFFRFAPQYENQVPIIDGKRHGKDVNLFKLFLEQSLHLLRPGGQCGIVIPSGIYTDLGAKSLREMLFSQTEIEGLFCFDNRKEIFEGVHRSYKFVVLTFSKGGKTERFPVAFMREDVEDLELFPEKIGQHISVDLIRRSSPDSLSIMEFKSPLDISIAEKILRFPLLGENCEGTWNFTLHRELNMTDDAYLFQGKSGEGKLPLYEGKMIWQFDHKYAEPRFWIDAKQGRKAMLGSSPDAGQKLSHHDFRVGYRSVGENTNERNLISAIIPPMHLCGNSIYLSEGFSIPPEVTVFVCALLNSFILDYSIRLKISRNINIFYVYQLPVPRLTVADAEFAPIVKRAAQLICTTPEFDALAKEVSTALKLPAVAVKGVTDPAARAQLRAELDGLIAHLYALTESEFTHILTTFPLVTQGVKDATLEAFKSFAPQSAGVQLAAEIAQGESATMEFMSSARWDFKENRVNKVMEQVILKTAAAFLNTDGGTLLIGVDDSGKAVGLENDFKTLGKKQDRDGFENFLTTLLLTDFGKDCAPMIQINFCQLEDKDVCRLTFKPSPKPAFVKDGNAEQLFIRAGNSTRQLTTKEALDYCKQRWP